MNLAGDKLFEFLPDPMWVYDLITLRFLLVNNAAIAKYGYSREEFLAMTITEIQPPEDRAARAENVAPIAEGRDQSGVWRHCLKSGEVIYVDITGQVIDHYGRQAELIAARDVSRFVVAQQTAVDALARENEARKRSDKLAQQFQIMFDSVPGKFIVFLPTTYDVIAVSDAYLSTLAATRPDVVGHNLFDVLPFQPGDTTHAKLRGSFHRVLATGRPDLLDFQCFLLPGEIERYWAVSSTPVVGPDEKLIHIILRMQDMTDAIHAIDGDPFTQDGPNPRTASIELIAHTRELVSDNINLALLAARLRTTQRLLGTGTWDYMIATDRMDWSSGVYKMYGTTPKMFGHRFDDYIALIHPDDRVKIRTSFDAFMASGDPYFWFAHQVVYQDGSVVHVHGVAEKMDAGQGPLLRGVVQDVTESVEAAEALAQAKRMLETAGTSANFGAWRYDVPNDLLEWSMQTTRIHDEPEGYSPSGTDGLSYYDTADRERLTGLFNSCKDRAQAFDETFRITSAKGRRIWVRVTGEAESDMTGRVIAVHGSVQDVSELVAAHKRAEDSEKLLEIAGHVGKFGGWRVNLADQAVSWTDGIALLHELPLGTRPTLERGIEYFAPEEQQSAREAFNACAKDGIPFDNFRDLVTAKGNRVRVRSMGEAVRDPTGMIIAVQGAMQDVTELTAAQQKADQLGTRLAETLEEIGDALFTIDLQWRFTYLNNRAEVLLERIRNDLIGHKFFDEFPDTLGTNLETEYSHAFATGETVRFEQYFGPLDRTFSVNAHPTSNGLAVYFSDISEERRRDEQFRLLDAALARINDLVIITEADQPNAAANCRIVYVNKAFERLTGYTSQEIVGQTPRILQGPKTQISELERIRNAIETRSPVRAELINYTKSGREYWLEIDIVPITDKAGVVTHFVAVQRDITDRRRTEEALRISEARFRFIAQATGNVVWEWDIVEGRMWWSDGLHELFGHQPDPEGKRPSVWRANVHPDDEKRLDESLDRLLLGQIESIDDCYQFRRADGTWANVDSRGFLIRNDEGHGVRVLGSITDISQRLETEDLLRQSLKLEAVGQLTGGLAHDFNNLLTVITGSTEMIQDQLEPESPLRRFADMTATAADRAAELTSRLLAFSRKQALQPRVMDANVAIAGIEEMLRRTLGEDIDIQLVATDDLWRIEVDPSQFETALLNLAINSRDAMPNGGSLIVETANVTFDANHAASALGLRAGQHVVIGISDNGHGIPKDQMTKVFEPFFTTKAVGTGTGLGLSMVYGFVKQSGGQIQIYSEINEGTTVRMYFPRLSGEQAPEVEESESEQVIHGKETILVVEDDALISQQLMEQLTGLGYKVITTSSGAPAIAILHERPEIDLLFTDVILPGGMNGRQIAEAAKLIRPGLKILYTSGYSESAIIHHGRLDQGVELLSKPYRRSDLASKVRKVLDS